MIPKVEYLTPLLSVFSMPRSLGFYRDILGFEVVSDSGDGDDSSWVWVRWGDLHLMLNDQYEPGHVPEAELPDRRKWHHDTCLHFGCRDVDGMYDFLRSKALEIDPPKDAPYGMRQLYLSDPDGYNICFQWQIEK